MKKTQSQEQNQSEDCVCERPNRGMAVLSYLGILFLIPLLAARTKNDDFVQFHARQGMTLFLMHMILNVALMIMQAFFSEGMAMGLRFVVSAGALVLQIIGIINVVNSKKEPLPLIGDFAKNFKF